MEVASGGGTCGCGGTRCCGIGLRANEDLVDRPSPAGRFTVALFGFWVGAGALTVGDGGR